MKTLLRGLVTAALLSAPVLAEERGPAVPDYPADRITDSVYVIHGPITTPNPENLGFMNNPGIVLTDAGIVIIDPGSSVQSGEMVLRVARTLSDQPVVAVFDTHVHGDHWLGNQAIRAAYPDAPIYGHPKMIAQIKDGADREWIELMLKVTEGKTAGTEAVGADHPVTDGDEITIGGTTFRVHHFGPAHTRTDNMIEVAEESVVFLGDNVLIGRIAPVRDGGSIAGIIDSLDRIQATGVDHYVPGHGPTGDHAVVDTMRRYYDTVYRNVQKMYEEGLSDFEMKDTISAQLEEYADWEDYQAQLGKHISQAYLAVEAEAF